MSTKNSKRKRWTIDHCRLSGTPLGIELERRSAHQRGRYLLALAEIGFHLSRGVIGPQVVPTAGAVATAASTVLDSVSDGQYIPPDIFSDIIDEALQSAKP